MTAEEFIEKQSYVIFNSKCPLVNKKDAEKAVEMARQEEREKACKAFKHMVKTYCGFYVSAFKKN